MATEENNLTDVQNVQNVQNARNGWGEQDHVPGIKSELLELNMGPQHPATHGVLRLLLQTDGEVVYKVTPVMGYLHRCAEKIAEGVNYKQFVVYTDRFDYLSPMTCNQAYVTAVENLMDVEIPERAEHLRIVTAELSRIASHLISLATFGLDMGAWTPLLYCFREREVILDLLERISGGDYNNLLSYNKIFTERLGDVAVISPETAIAYGCTGPVLRGSGVKFDTRKDDPYSLYHKFDWDVPVGLGEMGTVGDCWDRYMVRVREIEQSIRLVRQALEQLPEGPYQAIELKKPVKATPGATYTRVESSKGELGHYIISDGGQTAFRNKVRSPSFCNLQVMEKVGVGLMVSDLVALVGSLDIVLGEIDR